MSGAVTGVLIAALAVLGLALLLVTVRLARGPSALDRVVAVDALVAVILAGLTGYAALTGDTEVLPLVVATSLVGFLGSSTVARLLGSRTRHGSGGPDGSDDPERAGEPQRTGGEGS